MLGLVSSVAAAESAQDTAGDVTVQQAEVVDPAGTGAVAATDETTTDDTTLQEGATNGPPAPSHESGSEATDGLTQGTDDGEAIGTATGSTDGGAAQAPASVPDSPELSVQAPTDDAPTVGSESLQVTPNSVVNPGQVCPTTTQTGSMVVADFEIDGNCQVDSSGNLDWTSPEVGTQPVVVDQLNDATQYTHGSSEVNWPTWDQGSGTASGQADINDVYSWATTDDSDHIWAIIAFTRDTTGGTIGYTLELNQRPNTSANPAIPNRTTGDWRFNLTQAGNGALALSDCQQWTGVGSWAVQACPSTAFASAASTDKSFVEAALDLTVLTGLSPSCPVAQDAFSTVNLRSRQSAAFNSAIKDYAAPFAFVPPSTCGQLTLVKHVDQNDTNLTATAAQWQLLAASTTLGGQVHGPAAGSESGTVHTNVVPDAYLLSEIGVVPGYTNGTAWSCTDDATDASVTTTANVVRVAAEQHLTCTIVNTAIQDPDVTIVKQAWNVVAWGGWTLIGDITVPGIGDGAEVIGESVVTWSYLVTNTGNTELTSLVVVDDQLASVTCPATTLAAGASMLCHASGEVTAVPIAP